MAITGLKKKSTVQQKKQGLRFIVDCTAPVTDNVLDAAGLEKFFHDRIKVDGKTGQLGDLINITRDKAKITVTSDIAISKRYLKVSVRAKVPGNRSDCYHRR